MSIFSPKFGRKHIIENRGGGGVYFLLNIYTPGWMAMILNVSSASSNSSKMASEVVDKILSVVAKSISLQVDIIFILIEGQREVYNYNHFK